ncbi:septum formation family protein [Corynebacterium sp. UMB10321]|uniref:septum formation family protein n=2 Tax=Corynebacterium TaxID=1716 RepID=UPI00254D0CFC|nr:septum formation family protein [Corynebacterium sp. UMB10321]MDK8244772.1 septum formation family protein [Corynebacterium sp. UMB10321]
MHMASRTTALRGFLVALLAGAVGFGSYTYNASPAPQGGTDASGVSTSTPKRQSKNKPAPFTTADQGACLTWEADAEGHITAFEQTDCALEHRFEISAREDLATYPTSEFGPSAPMPNQTRQAQLREELCGGATLRYLNGAFDPNGRYSIAPILPPAAAWEDGDRTMLCGLQETDRDGTPILTTGRVSEQDQARTFNPGECVAIDGTSSLSSVDCNEPHQMEITSTVDLAPVFPDHTPSIEEQDNHLRDVCTDAAQKYMGAEENLYQIALQPFWTTQKPSAWEGGSHSVNCALVFSNPEGQFATLTGSATAGREVLKIDGNPPPERPERRPLREEQPRP